MAGLVRFCNRHHRTNLADCTLEGIALHALWSCLSYRLYIPSTRNTQCIDDTLYFSSTIVLYHLRSRRNFIGKIRRFFGSSLAKHRSRISLNFALNHTSPFLITDRKYPRTRDYRNELPVIIKCSQRIVKKL